MTTIDAYAQSYTDLGLKLYIPVYKYKLVISPSFIVYSNTRPNYFNRLMCKWLLGWKWEINNAN